MEREVKGEVRMKEGDSEDGERGEDEGEDEGRRWGG